MVFLISGQGYFTFLYQHTKYTTDWVKEKKNKQSLAWVSSKRKKGEVCDTFVHSVCLSANVSVYSSETPTKPLGMLTHFFTLVNPASSQVFLDRQLPPISVDWSVLSTGLFCPLLLTDSFSWLLSLAYWLWDIPSLVLFWSRGKTCAQAVCVSFAPKQTKGSSDWHHTHRNECHPSCHSIVKKYFLGKNIKYGILLNYTRSLSTLAS